MCDVLQSLGNNGVGKHWKGDEKKMNMITSRIFFLLFRLTQIETPQCRNQRIYFLVRACSSAQWKRRRYRYLCLVETAPGRNVHRHALGSY